MPHSNGMEQENQEDLPKNLCSNSNSVFRLADDKFTIVIEGKISKIKAKQIAQRLIDSLAIPFFLNESEYQISISIDDKRRNVTVAEPLTKEFNKTPEFDYPETHLAAELQQALDNKEFFLCYQPLFEFSSNNIIGVEALIRWQHPILGTISPRIFIPIAEKTGAIIPIGEWVLKEACLQKKAWSNIGHPDLLMAINISPYQLQQKNFTAIVQNIIKETNVDPGHLEFEISESTLSDIQNKTKKMLALKEQGIRLVLDDFGTGYSNPDELKNLPFDKIKIDKTLIDEITSNQNKQCLLDAIVETAQDMGAQVVAKGAETLEQVHYLLEHHSDQIQGFYYSKPLTAKACLHIFHKKHLI
ncbi:putative bifunctional diguanylate cyclase/phosphodiesterase [Legionella nagasakiensis]|uniref:putative bifunctional diguanylate cyclase/phosphodiesterase n=1 Tax=Legionella nagasakiensis TaxID=535290 RepID=UPI001055765A|nr:GGDEF domain-containing phosphodiesterase [Legionella nagasakiensis]